MSRQMRGVVAGVLVTMSIILVPLSVIGVWVVTTVTETDRYVATVAPLATDPAVKEKLEEVLVAEVMEAITAGEPMVRAGEQLEQEGAPPALIALLPRLGGAISAAIEGQVTTLVTQAVESPTFEAAWESANREAHEELIAVLSGESELIGASDDGQVSIRLAALASTLRAELEAADVGLGVPIPELTASFPIMQTEQLERAQGSYQTIGKVGALLPWLTAVVIALAVLTANRRRRVGLIISLGAAAGLVVVMLAARIGQSVAVDGLPGDESPQAAEAVLTIVLDPLRDSVRITVLVGIAIALVLMFVGRSPAVAARRRAWATSQSVRAVVGLAGGLALGWVLFGPDTEVGAGVLLLLGGLGMALLAWRWPAPSRSTDTAAMAGHD